MAAEPLDDAEAPSRPVRTYVLRQGRTSAAQKQACVRLLPRFGILYTPHVLDLADAFGRAAPKILEIGFGMGVATAEIAAAHPEQDFLALEVHTPGVGKLLQLIEGQSLTNLRLIQHDAVEVVRDMIGPQTLSGVHIFFPDPWPKKRHHKRRLIQPEFVTLLAGRMASGAHLHLATDWEDYAEQILAVLAAEPSLENSAADYVPRPAYRPETKFEARGVKLGHGVWDIVFRKR